MAENKVRLTFEASGCDFDVECVGFGAADGEGDGDKEPFLRLRRRAERSCSGVAGFEGVSLGLRRGLACDPVLG